MHADASRRVRSELLEALQLLGQLGHLVGPAIASALLAADVLGTLRQLWMLAHTDAGVLHALRSLVAELATAGKCPAVAAYMQTMAKPVQAKAKLCHTARQQCLHHRQHVR